MGLGQLLRPQHRAIRDPAWTAWGQGADVSFGATTDAGINVTQENSRQLLTVFGCQSLISDAVAMMPRDVYRKTGKVRVEIDGPFWLTDQANAETRPEEFVLQSVLSLLTDGNYFWVPVRDARAQVLEVWCLDPCRVVVRRESGGVRYYVDGRPFTGELVHGRWFLPPGEVRGINPIEVARQAIGLGLARNGSAPGFSRTAGFRRW
jgi:phage portal protein BeeE